MKKVVYTMLVESRDKEGRWTNTLRYKVMKKDMKLAITAAKRHFLDACMSSYGTKARIRS